MKFKRSKKGGFTLVEIMIVVAIIALLAAIAIPNFARARKTAWKNTCIANMKQIEGAAQQYAMDNSYSGAIDVTNLCGTGEDDYIRGGEPQCPAGTSNYADFDTGARPVCPNVGDFSDHVLP